MLRNNAAVTGIGTLYFFSNKYKQPDKFDTVVARKLTN